MALFCVGQICAELERLPSAETTRELEQEAARGRVSAETLTALTRARQVGAFARRPVLRPGESPR